MKTIFASVILSLALVSSAFAGGSKALPAKAGVAAHHLSTRDDNTVVFAYPSVKGTRYRWEQAEGPNNARLTGANTPTLIASRLKPGYYVFNYSATQPDGTVTQDQVVVKVKNHEG